MLLLVQDVDVDTDVEYDSVELLDVVVDVLEDVLVNEYCLLTNMAFVCA